MYEEDVGTDGFDRAIKKLATLFYEYDGLFASPRPAMLQEALDVLTGIFYRVGLRKNVNNRAGMVQPLDGRGGTYLSGKKAGEGPFTVIQGRSCGGVHDGTPPVSE